MRKLITSGRSQFALALLLIAGAILLVMQHYTTRAPAPIQTDAHQGADIFFTAAHPAVWRNNSCVDLTWRLSGISEVYINENATVGEATEAWCLPPPATYRGFYRDPAVAELRVRFMDGEIRRYNLPIYVMQPFIERIVLPLLLLSAALIASLYIPTRYTELLTRPRPVRIPPIDWRRVFGWLALIGIIGTLAAMAYRLTLEPPYRYITTAGDADIAFTVDPPVVFHSDGSGCTTLTWQSTNVEMLTLSGEPIPTNGEQAWCVPPRASMHIVQFEITAANGETHRRTVSVRALQPVLYYTVLPLLLIAVYAFWLYPHIRAAEGRYANNPVRRPFYNGQKLNHLLLALFLGINTLAISNIIRHNAGLAYDAEDHFLYSIILSQGRLPIGAETNQFFAPPLVYVFPALVHQGLTALGMEPCTAHQGPQLACQVVAKTAQSQNIIAALGITYLLVSIAGIIRPQDHLLKVHALFLLGMLPVFYKSLVFHRGEPFVALFALAISHHLLIMLSPGRHPTFTDGLILGLLMGLLIISRQWGVLALIGISLWALVVLIQRGRQSLPLLRVGLLAYLIAFLSGGWFYLLTRLRLGSVTAFNRAPDVAKSLEFYIGLGSGTLFSQPFRSARIAQILPIFYTETWGDYWGHFHLPNAYFSVWTATPPPAPLLYTSHVNRLALFPTFVLLAGAVFGFVQLYNWLRRREANPAFALLQLIIITSLLGYLWFLASYPHSVGDTIKTTYTLHIFPPLVLLTGAMLLRLRQWNGWLHAVFVIILAIILLYNLPMTVTHYT